MTIADYAAGAKITSTALNEILSRIQNGDYAGTDAALNIGRDLATGTEPVVKIEQGSATDGQPVVSLKQDDVSEGFLDLLGSDRGVIAGATSSLASARFELNGIIYRVALYVDA